jgi:serine/threonine protein kinase
MSPEQIMGKEIGPSSDFYSLATVLFELLAGKQLFKAKKVKDLFKTVVHQRAPRIDEVKPEIPFELAEMARALTPFIERFKIVEERPAAQQRFIKQLNSQLFFNTFSEVEIAQLLELVKIRLYAPGDVLIDTGDADRNLLIITRGTVKVTQDNKLVRLCSEGDCIGELGFIHGTPETKKMQALTDVNVMEVSADLLSELPPKVHLHYYRVISDVLVERLAREDQYKPDVLI